MIRMKCSNLENEFRVALVQCLTAPRYTAGPSTAFAANCRSNGPDKIWIAIALTPEMQASRSITELAPRSHMGHMAVGSAFN